LTSEKFPALYWKSVKACFHPSRQPSSRLDKERTMLNLFTGTSSDCTGTTRRQFLHIGGLSVLGLTLPGF
jgi:hypothetical protein